MTTINVAVAPLSDGRLQFWAVDRQGGVSTSWKTSTDPNAGWTSPTDFLESVGPLPTGCAQIAVAPLSDGRLQLWATDNAGGVSSTWKSSTDPNSSWTPWVDFLAGVGPLPAGCIEMAAAPLSDGRLQLWATDSKGGVSSCWKTSTDPNSSWTEWSRFEAEALQPA